MNTEPIVRIDNLTALDDLGAVRGLSLALPAGPVGALVGTPWDGTTALAAVLAGCLRPTRGSVVVAGKNPLQSPSVRARIGALLPSPPLPDVGTVRDLWALTRRLRRNEAPRDTWLEPLELGKLDRMRVAHLGPSQRRQVALGLALAIPSPTLLVLHEPLADLALPSVECLATLLKNRARNGACVLILTASITDATSLAEDLATLERGRVSRAVGEPDTMSLTPGGLLDLRIVADMPRALAAALILEPEIRAVHWLVDGDLGVRGTTAGLAGAVARVARDNGVEIRAIHPIVPSREEVNAATAGLVQASRAQAAYRSAYATTVKGPGDA